MDFDTVIETEVKCYRLEETGKSEKKGWQHMTSRPIVPGSKETEELS